MACSCLRKSNVQLSMRKNRGLQIDANMSHGLSLGFVDGKGKGKTNRKLKLFEPKTMLGCGLGIIEMQGINAIWPSRSPPIRRTSRTRLPIWVMTIRVPLQR